MATVSTPGLWSARLDLLQAEAEDEDAVAAADDVPDEAGADELEAELLELLLELPHAAISPAARTGNRTAEMRRARSKANNLHRCALYDAGAARPVVSGGARESRRDLDLSRLWRQLSAGRCGPGSLPPL